MKSFLKTKKIIIGVFALSVIILITFSAINLKSGSVSISPAAPVRPTSFPSGTPSIILSPLPSPVFAPDEIIIKYKAGKSPTELSGAELEQVNAVFQQAGVITQEKLYKKEESSILRNYYQLKLKPGTNISEAIEVIKKLEPIEYAQPNFIYKTQ